MGSRYEQVRVRIRVCSISMSNVKERESIVSGFHSDFLQIVFEPLK